MAAGSTAPQIDPHRDGRQLETYLRSSPYLHLYHLGDLDEPFARHAQWFGRPDEGPGAAVALFYRGVAPPVLLALTRCAEAHGPMAVLLRQLAPTLPDCLQVHLSPGLEQTLAPGFRLERLRSHVKMALLEPSDWGHWARPEVQRLGPPDAQQVLVLLAEAYPDHDFSPDMLAQRWTFGARVGGRLVSLAGTHVFSAAQRVAALGNVATHPDLRGQGWARATLARLCAELQPVVDHIGLNVRADNAAAVAMYTSLGFEAVYSYNELLAWRVEAKYRENGRPAD